MEQKYDFGLVGLGVMGRNFILNVADNGFKAFGNDLDDEKVAALIEEGGNTDKVNASSDAKTFVNALSTSSEDYAMLVPAGKIVDAVIESLLPLLDERRYHHRWGKFFFYRYRPPGSLFKGKKASISLGPACLAVPKAHAVGPSIMPGGNREAYQHVKQIFEAVSAKYKGEPCVAYLGPKSAGNYVKMVHNGIEYGLMQLTSEIYDLLKKAGGFFE